MATSSITKTFVIKDENARKRFEKVMKEPISSKPVVTDKLEKDRELFKQIFKR